MEMPEGRVSWQANTGYHNTNYRLSVTHSGIHILPPPSPLPLSLPPQSTHPNPQSKLFALLFWSLSLDYLSHHLSRVSPPFSPSLSLTLSLTGCNVTKTIHRLFNSNLYFIPIPLSWGGLKNPVIIP